MARRASFSDHLKLQEVSGSKKVLYDHELRCDLKVWLEKATNNKLGWQIHVQGNDHLVAAMKKDVFTHTIKYLQQRLQKDLVRITYDDIVMLTKAEVIKSVKRRGRVIE